MQEWYILGVGKGVLFREVSSVYIIAIAQGQYTQSLLRLTCLAVVGGCGCVSRCGTA